MYNKLSSVLCLIGLSLNAEVINIAVSANVSYAINDLKEAFLKTNPDTKINLTLGSSGKLTAQINHGAPYDLFMSANMKYPNNLYKNSLAITKPVVYTKGKLAYFSTKKYDFKEGINLLKRKEIKQIAIANPKTAPYGIASFEALKNAKIYDEIKSKFVYGESIAQTVAYAFSATDMGIIAKSSLYSSSMKKYKENINWKEVEPSLYTSINQGMVILKHAQDKKDVRKFYSFILSKQAQVIFEKYGYELP